MVAVMPVYNEADVILSTLRHLIAQGIEVYVLDNHSTDATAQLARSLLGHGVIAIETCPAEPTAYYEWEPLLRRVESLSETLDANWLMLHDAVRMQGEVAAKLARPAVGGGACAMATLVHVSPLAEAALDGLRDALEGAPAEWGASAWDGMLVARFLAPDGAALREAVVMGLQALRGDRPLPRVWLC